MMRGSGLESQASVQGMAQSGAACTCVNGIQKANEPASNNLPIESLPDRTETVLQLLQLCIRQWFEVRQSLRWLRARDAVRQRCAGKRQNPATGRSNQVHKSAKGTKLRAGERCG